MEVTKQYIDLFEQTQGLIDKYAPRTLNARRQAALTQLKGVGLPDSSQEAFAHTDVKAMFMPDYGMNLKRLDMPVNPYEVFKCDVPNLSTALYFMINDSFYIKEQPIGKLPEGVFIGSLRYFADQYPQIAEKYYDRQAATHQNGATALNTLFAQDGFVMYVPKGVKVDKTIQLVNVLRSDVDFLVNRRILIILEEAAEAKVLICDHTLNKAHFMINQVAELFIGEGAIFDYYELEENNRLTNRVSSTYLHQEANSNVVASSFTLTNGVTRNNFFTTFAGEHAETHLSGMAIADGEQHVDNFTFIDHAVPHCHSNELFKYVLNDKAQGVFSGRILVREGAQFTEAYQSNKNLCATQQARMYTRPELEIYADDVKCSHGATVGQLDEQALFYLRSRGIPENEARMLLMFAFSSDVIDQIRLEPLKERLRMLVEKRFRGELAKCKTCNQECH